MHSDILQILFPAQRGVGIDLGNIEIKESGKYDRIELKPSDYDAEFILGFNNKNYDFLLVDINDIPPPRKKRFKYKSVPWNWLEKMAIFQTNDEIEMLEQIKPFLSHPEVFSEV